MKNQSTLAIECLQSYCDFCDDKTERKAIQATIEFLEELPEGVPYEEILNILK